mmetsp:Transcript_15242/g.27690  ORF Transcript_15242/g.27690 Transcript_15242/m.27690 type:complete len:226 (-) Transcript_15242:941-1618(-)
MASNLDPRGNMDCNNSTEVAFAGRPVTINIDAGPSGEAATNSFSSSVILSSSLLSYFCSSTGCETCKRSSLVLSIMAFLASNLVPNPTNALVVVAGHTSNDFTPNNFATSSDIDCLCNTSSKSFTSPELSKRGTNPLTNKNPLYFFTNSSSGNFRSFGKVGRGSRLLSACFTFRSITAYFDGWFITANRKSSNSGPCGFNGNIASESGLLGLSNSGLSVSVTSRK